MTVQPDGTFSATVASLSGRNVGLLSVAVTVNVPAASIVDGTTPSVGAGAVGGPYTLAL